MSALLTKLAEKIQIARRGFKILPKKRKKIKLLYFKHVPDADSNDTLIIRYRFTNAIYYTIDGEKTFETRFVLARPEKERKLEMSVHGFFRKINYTVTVLPDDVIFTRVH